MKLDLHIHSEKSDGEIVFSSIDPKLFKHYKLISFTDHEHIFNPSQITSLSQTRFISGVELCCNHNGTNIEILGYNFDTKNSDMKTLVERIKNKRISIIKKILLENDINVDNIPKNPFRKNITLPAFVDLIAFWRNYTKEYKEECHSTPAFEVINTIKNANGIPVLAHPMESLSTKSKEEIEKFILSLKINTIELITPKHTNNDINLLQDIIQRHKLSASIGSDSHGLELSEINHKYNLNEPCFQWIHKLVNN